MSHSIVQPRWKFLELPSLELSVPPSPSAFHPKGFGSKSFHLTPAEHQVFVGFFSLPSCVNCQETPNPTLLGLFKVHTDPWAAAKNTPGVFHPCKKHTRSWPGAVWSAQLVFSGYLLIKISIKAPGDILCLELLLFPSGSEEKFGATVLVIIIIKKKKATISAGKWSLCVFRNLPKGWNLVRPRFWTTT